MIPKIRTDGFMIWLLLLMQLGFHTNTGYDDILSFVVSIFVLLYFIITSGHGARVKMTHGGKEYLIWYSIVMGWVGLSFIWATHSINKLFILQTYADTFVPLIITLLSISEYLKKGNTGKSLITALITAEIFVTIRALINTDIVRLFIDNNTRLYGKGLGVNYNHFTTQFALVLCITLFMAYNVSKLYYLPAVFLIANIVVSGSRKVLVASFAAFLVMYLLSSKGGSILKRIRTVVIILVVLGIALWLVLNNEFLFNLIGNKTLVAINEFFDIYVEGKGDASVDTRKELIRIATEVFMEHPILGVGYYCFLHYNRWQLYAHNNYLELLANLGIIGFTLYYVYYIKSILGFMGLDIGFDGPRLHLRRDKKKSVWNVLGITFIVTIVLLEFGQVTFFRLYALIPLLVVVLGIENMKNKDTVKRSLR